MRGHVLIGALSLATTTACKSTAITVTTLSDAEATDVSRLQTMQLTVAPGDVDPTFDVRDHFVAAVEMQLSGEPLATTMGRNLADYSRDHLPTNIYFDPTIPGDTGRVDLVGFSSAVESYEYSKQPLNNVGLESGAGVSGLFGPVTNPKGATGTDALALMRTFVQAAGVHSNLASKPLLTTGAPDAGVTTWWTETAKTPLLGENPLGWRGLEPIMLPFSSFDPHMAPTDSVSEHCSITSDDDPGVTGSIQSNDYECDYTGLHLPNRAKQVSMTVDPGASGWHSWKAALWVLNYLEVMHDSGENPILTVPEDQLSLVGTANNQILGNAGPGNPALPGVYLGSSDIEGFQAAMFIEMMNNQVEEWLTRLATTDGKTLSGFSSLMEATQYSTSSPLRWFPSSLSVEEVSDASGFPRPAKFDVASPDSDLLDLAGMLGAYASLYALTDHNNAITGNAQPARAYFDGDPFADDDQIADGQPTTHDRMLAMMRVLVVNMERIHRDPTSGLLVDEVSMTGAVPSRGATLSPDVAAYTLLALRAARRALDSELVLYSNTTPDMEGIPTPLDGPGFPRIRGTNGDEMAFGQELDSLIDTLAGAFYDDFTTADGVAYAGWDVASSTPTDDGSTLDAHSAAVRGLLVAYLATGNVKYRDRALVVYQRLESVFYYAAARVYQTTAGSPPTKVTFTPRRFGILQGALRDIYELIAVNAGEEALAAQVTDRLARLNKLVLNGWDDRNEDEQIGWPCECVSYSTDYSGPGSQYAIDIGGQADILVHGGLEMAERTLTGEMGSLADVPTAAPRIVTTDREEDCVPEVSAVGLPAALANSITFTISPYDYDDAGACMVNGAPVNASP